jgi:hypothetical protein
VSPDGTHPVLLEMRLIRKRFGEAIVLEGVDLETVLREVISDLGHEIEARRAEVRLDVPPLTVLAHIRTSALSLTAAAMDSACSRKAASSRQL